MVLNPFYILMFLYFFSNTYAFFLILNKGGTVHFGRFYSTDVNNAVLAYVVQLVVLFLLYLFFKFSFKGFVIKKKLDDNWGVFLIFITGSFFIFNQVTGAGVAGSGFSFSDLNIYNIIFVLLQPDLWFFLIAPFLKSNRLFWFSLVLYTLSLLTRGWMGATFLVLIIFLIREYPVKLKIKNFMYFASGLVVLILMLPLLDALKWGFRLGISFDVVLSRLLDIGYFSVFGIVFESVITRFQNLNYVVYVLENRELFLDELLMGNIKWFYHAGIISSAYCSIVSCSTDFNIYTAEVLYGQSDLSWNIDPGISGWIVMLGFYSVFIFVFSAFLLYFSARLFRHIYGRDGILLLFCFSLIYFFHGWFGAFYNIIFYSLIFYLLKRLKSFNFIKRF